MTTLDPCPVCAVAPGRAHVDGCSVERCPICARQRIACGHRLRLRSRWTGVYPGTVEAAVLGMWCRTLRMDGTPAVAPWDGVERLRWHVPCAATDPGARPDLNAYHEHAMQAAARRRWRFHRGQ